MPAYHRTFISHAHVDNALCDRYAAALRAKGIDIWYDRDNAQAGKFLGDAIQHELEHRSAFVLLLTQTAIDSFWVKLEQQAYLGLMGQDRNQMRILLPVRIGPCTVPTLLNALIWVDAQAMSFDQAIDDISRALTVDDRVLAANPHLAAQTAPPISPSSTASVLPGASTAPTVMPHLTPTPLYTLGYRGYAVNGVECILPPICPVPGGVFIIGDDKARDAQAYESDELQYPIEVAPFGIAQHPVTVAEYACAVRAKAVREPWGSGEITWQKQLTRGDHPVVCVSWQDAVAYARWLASSTGQKWRLPTEAEWDKAARWDAQHQVSHVYPWGDTFDQSRCNTSEGTNGTTTPVGTYPTGASPFGVQDMAGNVWEWTSSLYYHKLYQYMQPGGREDSNSTRHLVLRGGSWSVDSRNTRAGYRLIARPDGFGTDMGFRLMLSA